MRRASPHPLVLAAALAAGVLPSCRGGDAPGGNQGSAAGAGAAAKRPGDRYTVRGEVVRVPRPGASPRELSIRHEAIPDFRIASGAVVGMRPMVMPFDVAAGVPLDGLEAGDKIRFRFVMDWANNASEIEELEELPRDTALDFGAR